MERRIWRLSVFLLKYTSLFFISICVDMILIEALKVFRVPRSNVEVVRGEKGREKMLRIRDLETGKGENDNEGNGEGAVLQAVRKKLEDAVVSK